MLLLLPLLLPLIATLPTASPSPFSIFGGDLVEKTIGNKFCNVLSSFKTIKHFLKPKKISYEQTVRDLQFVNAMQTLDVKTKRFGTDITHPSWISVFAFHVGITYCDANSTVMSKFSDSIPDLPEGLPTGKFQVDSITDFNQLEGKIVKIVDKIKKATDGRFTISVSDDQKLIVLSWRGSETIKDYIANTDGDALTFSSPLMTPFHDGSSNIGNPKCLVPKDTTGMFVFAGFAKVMQNKVMLDFVIPKLRNVQNRKPGYAVVINGHSLGAAKAFINAFYLVKFYPDINFKALYSIEQPLIGSTSMATWMSDCIGPEKIVRVVSSNDLVPWARYAKNVRHPESVREIFNVDSDKNEFITCQGPGDKRCSKKYNCLKRNWDNHSRIGGIQLGGTFCNIIGVPDK